MLIVGCGYVGRRVAALHLARGEAVTGVVRSAASAQALAEAGIEPVRADLDVDRLDLPTQGVGVYYFAPPPDTGATDPRLGRFLATLPASGQPLCSMCASNSGRKRRTK